MITIRLARFDEIPLIMEFVESNWKHGHILGTDRRFFDWMFTEGEKVNVVIAIDEENERLYGIEGVIVYNHEDKPDVSGVMWKVIKSDDPFLGIEILDFIKKSMGVRYSVGIGLNKKAGKIFQLYSGKENSIARMDRFYRLGKRESFSVADIRNPRSQEYVKAESYFRELEDIREFMNAIPDSELRKYVPYKDYEYIRHRYFDHDIYTYRIFQLVVDGIGREAAFVFRKVEVNDTCVLKHIDYFGESNLIAYAGMAIDSLIEQYDAEYADLYSYGIDGSLVRSAGFIQASEDDENIIPNYFEPFERVNVDIWVSDILYDGVSIRIFRGDGDMDRPSSRQTVI